MRNNFINLFERDMIATDDGWLLESESSFYKGKKLDKPKVIECHFGNYYSSKKFIHIELIPSITGYRDLQMDEGFETEDKIIFGYKSYSLIFSFLFWYFEISLNLLTNKWMKNE